MAIPAGPVGSHYIGSKAAMALPADCMTGGCLAPFAC
jgi:hypothetical protein